MSLEALFNIGVSIAVILGGTLSGLKARAWLKNVESKIPQPPTDETREQAEQALRDKINRELGVQLNERDRKIKTLETSDLDKQARINALETEQKAKEREIYVLNQQVARLEREHEQEETERKTAEIRANEAEKSNVSLVTKLEIYEATLKLIQDLVTRPIQITLSIDGLLAQKTQVESVPPVESQ